jgi:hypothetical protein
MATNSGGVLRAKVAGIPLPIIIVGGVAAGYLLWTKFKGTGNAQLAATTPAATNAATSASDEATTAAVNQVGQQDAQNQQMLAQEIASNEAAGFATLEAQIAQMFPSAGGNSSTSTTPPPTTTPTPAPAPSQPAAPAQVGYGTVTTALGQMIWLGNWGNPHFQVGGGAPVYFGNASSLNQGSQYEVPGADIYTPVAYASLVSSAPS